MECGIVYRQILINAKLEIVEREVKKTGLTGSNPSRRRRSLLDCSAV
jgi:hypothetical protein